MNIEFESNCIERLVETENIRSQGFSTTDSPEDEQLILYHFVGCPYCSVVRSPINRLGIDVDLDKPVLYFQSIFWGQRQ